MATEVISREAQRAAPRYAITATKPIRVDLGPAGSGQVLEISQTGIRVKGVAALRRDTTLPMRIEIPETSRTLKCTGVVVWSKPTGAAGLKFKDLDEEQQAVLTGWLEELRGATSEEKAPPDEFARITSQIKAMNLNNADALSLIVRRVAQLATASGVAIALGKPENMVCLGRGGNAPELGSVISPTSGLTGECVRGRKPALCDDAGVDPRGADLKQGSALILPLLVNGEVRGVMQVFSAQPRVFDAKRIENMEKLADAVVFVAHNVTPQRRLATVTPMPKPVAGPAPISAAPIVTRPSQPVASKVTPIATRPASAPPASKPSDSGRIGAFTGPVVKLPVIPAPKPESAYEQPIEVLKPPLTVAAEPSVVTPLELEPLAGSVDDHAFSAPRYAESVERASHPIASATGTTYHVHPPKKPAWLIAAPIAAVLAVAAGGTYWATHRSHSPATAAIAATVPPAAAPVAEPPANAIVATPEPSQPVPAVPVSAPVAKSQPASPAPIVKAAERAERKAEPVVEAPAPMMIASGAPVKRPANVDESDLAAPSATSIAAGSSMPGIVLPTAAATPRLLAPKASTLTGGTLLVHVPPVYPQVAKAQHIDGKVEVLAMITTSGTVDRVRKVSGNAFLVQATIDAVKRWRYEPFKLDGQPIEKEISIEVNFKTPN